MHGHRDIACHVALSFASAKRGESSSIRQILILRARHVVMSFASCRSQSAQQQSSYVHERSMKAMNDAGELRPQIDSAVLSGVFAAVFNKLRLRRHTDAGYKTKNITFD